MKIKSRVLTRSDEFGVESHDSIAWAFEVHLKQPDPGTYHAAILYGNEEAPEEIDFYTQAEPLASDSPVYVWQPHTQETSARQ